MNDIEREAHIKDCGRRMQAAYTQGNRQEADAWLQAQSEAIRGRSAAQVARMEGCFFLETATRDRAMLERKVA